MKKHAKPFQVLEMGQERRDRLRGREFVLTTLAPGRTSLILRMPGTSTTWKLR